MAHQRAVRRRRQYFRIQCFNVLGLKTVPKNADVIVVKLVRRHVVEEQRPGAS